jgi:hypothetical protein
MSFASFVANWLAEKYLLDASLKPESSRPRRFLSDQKLARAFLERGIHTHEYIQHHLKERAKLSALGTLDSALPEHYLRDALLCRHLASRGLGAAYLAAHAAERAQLDAAGVPEAQRSAIYQADAKMVRKMEGRGGSPSPTRAASPAATARQQQQQAERQLLQPPPSFTLSPRRAVPVSQLSHWVGGALPLASWRAPAADTLRIMGRSELALTQAAVGSGPGSLGSSGSGGGGGGSSSRRKAEQQCCCGWGNCIWHKTQKAADHRAILLERGHKVDEW